MAEEELVSGQGWISDESSFYGDDDEQERLLSICEDFDPKTFWRFRKKDLNCQLSHLKSEQSKVLASTDLVTNNLDTTSIQDKEALQPSMSSVNRRTNAVPDSSNESTFLFDRRAMEDARLARLGKRKREPSPEPTPFNPGQGKDDAWQLGESVDDFVERLPPRTTSILTAPWIWVHNPRQSLADRGVRPRVDDFTSRGELMLSKSLQNRQAIQSTNRHGPKGMLTRLLNQESKELQQRITDLAADCRVLSGKWMLFPSPENVTQVWKAVVQGTIESRLGSTAKVATDEGNPGDRLVCIYTKDFRDEDDVARVLQQLETMGLLSTGRTIYYKSDAYTYLNLYKETAAEYGLQASLYNSSKMMNASKLQKATSSGPQKKQLKLNSYF